MFLYGVCLCQLLLQLLCFICTSSSLQSLPRHKRSNHFVNFSIWPTPECHNSHSRWQNITHASHRTQLRRRGNNARAQFVPGLRPPSLCHSGSTIQYHFKRKQPRKHFNTTIATDRQQSYAAQHNFTKLHQALWKDPFAFKTTSFTCAYCEVVIASWKSSKVAGSTITRSGHESTDSAGLLSFTVETKSNKQDRIIFVIDFQERVRWTGQSCCSLSLLCPEPGLVCPPRLLSGRPRSPGRRMSSTGTIIQFKNISD